MSSDERDGADGYDMVGDDTPVDPLPPIPWTGADSLERTLAVAEEVRIGPGDASTANWSSPQERQNGCVTNFDHGEQRMTIWKSGDRFRLEEFGVFGLRHPWSDDALFQSVARELHRLACEVGRLRRDAIERERAAKMPADPSPPTEPRFGERLRDWLCNEWLDIKATDDAGLRDLADAIDRDANRLRDHRAESLDTQRIKLRRQVEQLVEELRYSVDGPWREPVDVLYVERFLERLAGIFEGGSVGAADTAQPSA